MALTLFLKYLKFFLIALSVWGLFISLFFRGEIHEFHFVGIVLCIFFYLILRVCSFRWSFSNFRTSYFKIFSVALVLRIIFVFLFAEYLEYFNGFPFINQKDDTVYNNAATQIAKNWQLHGINFQSGIPLSTGFYSGFPNFSAFLMYLFGEYWWVPRLGNAVVSAFTVVFFAKITNLIFPKDVSFLGIALMICSPIFITYSSLQLKDTLLVFLICATFYYLLLLLMKRFNFFHAIFIILFLTLMIFIRAATILPIIMAGLLCAYYTKRTQFHLGKKMVSFIFFLLILGGIFLLWDFLSLQSLLESPEVYFTTRYNILFGETNLTRNDSSISGSNLAFILSTPLFLAGSLFLPIPLAVELPDFDYFTNYYYTSHLFLFALLPFFIQALVKWVKFRYQHKYIILFISFFFMYKIGQAFSLSLFSLRQSLPTILCLHLILPLIFMYRPSRKGIILSFVVCMICMIAFAFVRLLTRGLV